MPNIFSSIVFLAALFLLPAFRWQTANAQALPAGIGPGGYVSVGAGGSIFNSDYGKNSLVGPYIWVDVNMPRKIGLEAEARFLRYHQQADVKQDTYLIGPRYAFKPSRWVPYVKFPVGVGHMRFPYDYAKGTYFVMAPGAGLDYWLNDRVRFRVIDFEYQVWPQFTFGTLHPYGATMGISFRIH